jgi:hypothetical protein
METFRSGRRHIKQEFDDSIIALVGTALPMTFREHAWRRQWLRQMVIVLSSL